MKDDLKLHIPTDREIERKNRHSIAIDMVYEELNRKRQMNPYIPYLERSHIRLVVNEYLSHTPGVREE